MWQDKKFIVIVGLLVVIIAAVGTIGGLALYRQYNNGDDQLRASRTELIQQASNFLQNHQQNNIPDAIQNLDNYLNQLVKDGKITQAQADQFKEWFKDRPDIPAIFGPLLNGGDGFGFKFGQ
jgi:type II secretory pathway pseudopilin PulG